VARRLLSLAHIRSAQGALSTRKHTLQLSLLATLGLVPIACGGSTVTVAPTGETGGSAGLGGDVSSGGVGTPVAGTVSYGGNAVSYGGTNTIGGSAPTTGGAGQRPIPACNAPMVDPMTHLVTCSNGFMHRPTAVTCSRPLDSPAADAADAAGAAGAAGDTGDTGGPHYCEEDADCSSFRLGYCSRTSNQPSCLSGCLQDSDCAAGLCLCDGSAHGGVCTSATCKIDAECGSNSLCASANALCGETNFGCLSAQDECHSSVDCGPNRECQLAEEPYRTCGSVCAE
jgi:hypothetical protein